MTSDTEVREIYFGSPAWEEEPVNAAVLARMERLAAVRIAVNELEAARYQEDRLHVPASARDTANGLPAAEEKMRTMTKKAAHGQ